MDAIFSAAEEDTKQFQKRAQKSVIVCFSGVAKLSVKIALFLTISMCAYDYPLKVWRC